MMKVITVMLVVAMAFMVLAPATSAVEGEGRGGLMGFIAGCCFGIRAGGDYNEGKDIHWREWCTLIPYVNIVFAIWNGIDGMNGVTTSEYAKEYGSQYY